MKVKIGISLLLPTIAMAYFWPAKKVFSIKNIKEQPSILFENTCTYNSFYIEDKHGNELSSIEYSNIPGEGRRFQINTFISIKKLLNTQIEQNHTYKLSATTECAEYPIYRKYIVFELSNDNVEILKSN